MDLIAGSLDNDQYSEVIQCIKNDELEQAERMCLMSLDTSSDDYICWALMGLVYLLRADVKSAGEAIEKASRLAPESPLTLNLMGEFLCCNGKNELGEAALHRSLEQEPDQEFPLRMLLHQYAQRVDLDQMVAVLLKLVRLCPDDDTVWNDLRGCISRMKDSGRYEEECGQLAHEFADRHMALHIHACCLLALGDVGQAEKVVKTALALHGNDDQTWHLYGSILNVQDRPKAAVKAHRKAVLLNKDNSEAWMSLGIALIKCGKRSQAKKAVNRSIALDPARAQRVAEHMMRKGPV